MDQLPPRMQKAMDKRRRLESKMQAPPPGGGGRTGSRTPMFPRRREDRVPIYRQRKFLAALGALIAAIVAHQMGRIDPELIQELVESFAEEAPQRVVEQPQEVVGE